MIKNVDMKKIEFMDNDAVFEFRAAVELVTAARGFIFFHYSLFR